MSASPLDHPPFHAVPSVHWAPFFAARVLERVARVRPDAVAVELVPEALDAYVLAVKRFPRLSAVVTDAGQLYPVLPTDSIAQAIRSALSQDLPLHAIDVPRQGPVPPQINTLVPPALGDVRGLKEYYRLASVLVQPAPPDTPDDLRERAMASALLSLSCSRTLVVLGLAHWEALKRHLSSPSPFVPPPRSAPFKLVHLTGRAAYHYTGQMPYLIAAYELSADRRRFSTRASTYKLFLDAARKAELRLSPADQGLLTRYSRNLAIVGQGLDPSLFDLTLSAKAMVSDAYAGEVHDLGLRYPWDEDASGLPVLDVTATDCSTLDGQPRAFTLAIPGPSRSLADLASARGQGKATPRHPDQGGYYSGHDNFGRFIDEARREERYLEYLRRFALQRLTSAEWHSEEFATGLMDGVDVRATLRDLRGRTWVKLLEKAPGDIGAVYVDFDVSSPDLDHAYCYAAHRGLGLYSDQGEVNPGVDRCSWSILLSFLRRIPESRLYSLYDTWLRQGGTPQALQSLALRHAAGPLVLFVTSAPPTQSLRTLATRLGKRLVHVPVSAVPAIPFAEAAKHHIYWY